MKAAMTGYVPFALVFAVAVISLHGCGGDDRQPQEPKVISGSGSWKYEYIPDLVKLPASEADNDQNGHGLCRDLDNNIYFTFVPKNVSNTTQVLVRFKPDGSDATLLGQPGPEGLATGTPHGLRFEYDAKANRSFLYHSNNNALVIKTTLEGKVVWKADLSNWNKTHPQFWPVRPTQAVVVPGTDILLVADGYGSSWVHAFNKTTGQFLQDKSFGGKGNGTNPVQFNTPHGIKDDPRVPGSFVVSDRTNNRLVWVTAAGKFLKAEPTTTVPGMSLPCNVDVHEDEQAGNVSITPSLGRSYSNLSDGSAAIYAPNGTVLSILEVAKHIGHLGHQHPHDAIFLPNGDVVICCWSGPGTPGMGPAKGTISYWRRLGGGVEEAERVII